MRNFKDLDGGLKEEILNEFFIFKIDYTDIERIYNVSKESFRQFLNDNANSRFYEEYPRPEKQEDFFQKAIEYVKEPRRNLLLSLSLSVLLFGLFYLFQFAFKYLKFDPISNLLLSSTFGAGALWLVVVTLSNNLMFFSDIENFLYFLQGKKYFTKDYGEDLQNGLTTYERCTLNQHKRLFYVLLFAFLYWVILRTYPTASGF